jgi:hypothetical protein
MDRPIVPKGFRGASKKKLQAKIKKPGQGLEARASYASQGQGRGGTGRLSQGRGGRALNARKSRKSGAAKNRNSIILKPKPVGRQFEMENLMYRHVVDSTGVDSTGVDQLDSATDSAAGELANDGDTSGSVWSNGLFAVDEGQLLKFGVAAASPDRIWSLFEKTLVVDLLGSAAEGSVEDGAANADGAGGAVAEAAEQGADQGGGGDLEGRDDDGLFGYRNPMANRKGTTDANFQFEISDTGLSDITIRFMATSVEQKDAWVQRIRNGIKLAQLQHLAQLHADTALETAMAAIQQVEAEADPEQQRSTNVRKQFRSSVTKVVIANRFKTDTKTEAAAADAERMVMELEAAVDGSVGSSASGAGDIEGLSGQTGGEEEGGGGRRRKLRFTRNSFKRQF